MAEESVQEHVRRVAEEARAASGALAQTSAAQRNDALAAMAAALRTHARAIVEANGRDMEAARGGHEREPARPPHARRCARRGHGGGA